MTNYQMDEIEDVVYRVNHRDELCFANAAYDAFALANNGAQFVASRVLDRPLWDFITDTTTQTLYRDILRRAREGRPLQFCFRCDSPAYRRVLEMEVTGKHHVVEFRVRTVAEVNRQPQVALVAGISRSADVLSVCSWCKKIRIDDMWVEIDDAIAYRRLFDCELLPDITHGICEACRQSMQDRLAKP